MKLILFVLVSISMSCSTTQEEGNQDEIPTSYVDSIPELTPKQQAAFDALNILQTSTDQMNRLYSTFANIDQPCYPPDTIIRISRAELLNAMNIFVAKHCTNLSIEERDKLAATAVLAQATYTVSFCPNNSANLNYENGLPIAGIWVMPGILGRRDVILVW